MKHELLFLGKTKDGSIAASIDKYLARLKHYTSCSIKVIKEKKTGGKTDIRQEAKQLLQAVPSNRLVIALDSRGQQLSSEQFSERICSWENRGVRGVCYLIGGAEGLASEVLKRADFCLSLSRMTFTHDMARVLLIEQIYRAYTIKAGEKYHK